MKTSFLQFNILPIAVPPLRISPLLIRISPLLIRIATIALTYAAVITFNAVKFKSIGSGIDIFSGVFNETLSSQLLLSSLPLVKLRRLTKAFFFPLGTLGNQTKLTWIRQFTCRTLIIQPLRVPLLPEHRTYSRGQSEARLL
jgi:hypothetical protein